MPPPRKRVSVPRRKPFDPEGRGFDHASAARAGLKANKGGHFPSRVPETGLILKGRRHPTFNKTVAAEKRLGFTIRKRGKRFFSTRGK